MLTKNLDAAILTGAYGNQFDIDISLAESALLFFDYTKGDETSMQYKVDVAIKDDQGADYWMPLVVETTLTGTQSVRIPVDALLVDEKLRVSVKATGGTPTGTLTALSTPNMRSI